MESEAKDMLALTETHQREPHQAISIETERGPFEPGRDPEHDGLGSGGLERRKMTTGIGQGGTASTTCTGRPSRGTIRVRRIS